LVFDYLTDTSEGDGSWMERSAPPLNLIFLLLAAIDCGSCREKLFASDFFNSVTKTFVMIFDWHQHFALWRRFVEWQWI